MEDNSLFYADGLTSPQEIGFGTTVPRTQGRVVLRGDGVKDDSGSCAVFTEQARQHHK